MGKPTGFLEYTRQGNPCEPPLERIQHWSEFHPRLGRDERRRQGARCMECGVPFCQSGQVLNGMVSGCPLNNLVPEWNDLIYTGNFTYALQRLLKTNNFPEFTGRVCPALCESACTCGLNDTPVTIKENELGIIEDAFEKGLMRPRPPALRSGKRVAVVGSGPAGLACADQLNHRGHLVTVYERSDRIGGLLMYGIPNMKLEKNIIERRVDLMASEGVIFETGVDVGKDLPAQTLLSEFDAVVLCCGAGKPRDLSVPGREGAGVYFAVDFLSESTRKILSPDYKPTVTAKGKRVIVIGGGDTGNDCVGTSIRQGCKSVLQLEMMPKAPDARTADNPWPEWPKISKTDYGQEEAIAVFGADPRCYQTTVTEMLRNEKGSLTAVKTISLDSSLKPIEGSEQIMECDLLLLAAGFLGPQDYVLDALSLTRTPRSCVQTPDGSYATSAARVFSAGDMRRGQSLVVWAIQEGRCAAREVDEFLIGFTNLP